MAMYSVYVCMCVRVYRPTWPCGARGGGGGGVCVVKGGISYRKPVLLLPLFS